MGTAHQTRSGSYRREVSDPLLSLPFDYGKMRRDLITRVSDIPLLMIMGTRPVEYPSRKMTFTILLPTKQRS